MRRKVPASVPMASAWFFRHFYAGALSCPLALVELRCLGDGLKFLDIPIAKWNSFALIEAAFCAAPSKKACLMAELCDSSEMELNSPWRPVPGFFPCSWLSRLVAFSDKLNG
jgi:hypothetical protein